MLRHVSEQVASRDRGRLEVTVGDHAGCWVRGRLLNQQPPAPPLPHRRRRSLRGGQAPAHRRVFNGIAGRARPGRLLHAQLVQQVAPVFGGQVLDPMRSIILRARRSRSLNLCPATFVGDIDRYSGFPQQPCRQFRPLVKRFQAKLSRVVDQQAGIARSAGPCPAATGRLPEKHIAYGTSARSISDGVRRPLRRRCSTRRSTPPLSWLVGEQRKR